MAITIHTSPKSIVGSDNPITWVFSSNQTAQANFSYVIKTLLNNQIVQEDRVFPQLGARSFWDASLAIKNRLTKQPLNRTLLYRDNTTWSDVQLQIFESYGTPPTLQLQQNTSIVEAFKACLAPEKYLQIDYPTDWKQKKLLTNYPSLKREVLRGVDYYASFIVDGNDQLDLTTYDADGVQIGFYQEQLLGKELLDFNFNTDILSSFFTADFTGVKSFTIQFNNSLIYEFEIYDGCCHTPYQLVWQNEYGAFDQLIIKHANNTGGEIEQFGYMKQFGNWVGNDFVYSLDQTGELDVLKRLKETGELVTDYLTESVYNWLVNELYKSPRVYLFDVDNNYIQINIEGRNFKNKIVRFDELLSEVINYSKSQITNSIVI